LRQRVAAPRDVALQPCLHYNLVALHGIGTQFATAGRFKCAGEPSGCIVQTWRPFAIDTDRFGPIPNHAHIENRFTDDHPLRRHTGKLKGRRIAGQKRQEHPKKAHKPTLPRHG